jgi:hypothetical protein
MFRQEFGSAALMSGQRGVGILLHGQIAERDDAYRPAR